MATETVRIRSVSFYTKVDGKRRETMLNYGDEVPSNAPSEQVVKWRESGFIAAGPAPRLTGAQVANPSPDSTAFDDRVGLTAEGVPPDAGTVEVAAPDATTADTAALAAYIDSAKLTAPQTVELAAGDPVLAAKVLEAESLAQGGDGRSTVTGPLQKIIAGQ
jgi:hypothetical protein